MKLDAPQQHASEGQEGDHPADHYSPPVAGSPFIAVSLLAAAVRRRWRVWAATGLAGAAAALTLTLASAPTATTTLILGHPSQLDPAQAMVTDEQLLRTTTVARGALERLNLRESPREFLDQYTVRTLSPEILQVTAAGPTTREAVRRADALASAFLDFRRGEIDRQSQLAVQALEDRKVPLTAELADVNAKINATAEQTNDAAVRAFGDFVARRSSLIDQLSTLQQRSEAVVAETRAFEDKSRVIDPASPERRDSFKTIASNIGAGIVGGTFLGIGWIVVAVIASDRVRYRDGVSIALGAPVAVSVRGLRGRRGLQRRRFLRHLSHPQGDLARLIGHLRNCLSGLGATKTALVVVSVESDWASALAIAATAAELTESGERVLVADVSQRSVLSKLFKVPVDELSTVQVRSETRALSVALPPGERRDADFEIEMDDARRKADVVLLLASLDYGLGARHLAEWATTAVVVVTSGCCSSTALRSISQMLHAAGLQLDSAILVGATPGDDSVGLPDRVPVTLTVDTSPFWTNR